jgi:hypothetical protein
MQSPLSLNGDMRNILYHISIILYHQYFALLQQKYCRKRI